MTNVFIGGSRAVSMLNATIRERLASISTRDSEGRAIRSFLAEAAPFVVWA